MEAVKSSSDAIIEVPKVIDQEQVDFFVENGYVIVPDVIDADELE